MLNKINETKKIKNKKNSAIVAPKCKLVLVQKQKPLNLSYSRERAPRVLESHRDTHTHGEKKYTRTQRLAFDTHTHAHTETLTRNCSVTVLNFNFILFSLVCRVIVCVYAVLHFVRVRGAG